MHSGPFAHSHAVCLPGRVQLIRRHELDSSRTKVRWYRMSHVAVRAPEGQPAWVRRFAKGNREPEGGGRAREGV